MSAVAQIKPDTLPENFTVWTEIPVRDLKKAVLFYSTVFQVDLKIEDMEPNPVAMLPTKDEKGIAGHLYPGKPAADGAGPTVHLHCPDSVESGLKRVEEAGGTVLSDVIDIPPGRFAYCLDPDGNSIGLFTYKG